jgi:hypothetical protein
MSETPVQELMTVIKDINERGRGYRIRIDGEWYEVSVTHCEPPDTEGDIVDSETI